jgi:hypothetical protein
MFGGDVVGLSIAIHYGAFKSYVPTRNLAIYHRILFAMAFCCDYVSEQKFWTKLPLWQISFSSNVESFLLKNLGDLPFDQVILMLYLVSSILTQSTKIWRYCIIAFLHCTIPYASSRKCVYNLERECKYLVQSYMYPIQPCCHRMLSLASSGLLPLELYLAPHPLDLPCASHVMLAIKEHLVCGASSRWFGHAEMLSCKLIVIVHGPLGPILS